ncbi:MAG TPA: DUF3352 domain-containing protein [Acidimicrobiales bacterium]|jgi:hypothetical protein
MRVRGLVAGVVAGALLLTLPGCGKKTDEAARAAGITPANALGFLTLSLEPSVDQKRNMFEISRKFPDAKAREDFDKTKNDLLQRMLEDSGLDYAKDVEPWLGSEIALAVLPGPDGREPVIALFLEQDDEDKARAALDKANQKATAEGSTPIEYRFVDEFAVIAPDEDAARRKAALDAVEAQSKAEDGDLADSAEFGDVVDELHGDRLMLGWVDTQEALKTIEQFMDGNGIDLGAALNAASATAFDLHTERNAVVFQGVARGKEPAGGGDPKLTKTLPGDSFGALTVFDLPKAIRDTLAAMRQGGTDPLAEFREETGIDVEADVLSWMGGEAVLVSAPAPGGRDIPEFALVVEPSDRPKAEASVQKIVASLEEAMGGELERRQIAGATAFVIPEEDEGIQPAMGLFADRFVMATTPAYLEKLATAANPGFAGSPVYESVLGKAESSPTRFQLVLDLDAIREAIEKALPQEDRAEYEADTKRNVEPFDAVGMTARRDGEFERFEMKLTFD